MGKNIHKLKSKSNIEFDDETFKEYNIDIDSCMDELLQKLSEEIIVPESKLRYPMEKKFRLSNSLHNFTRRNYNSKSIGDFLHSYNGMINMLIEVSYNYRSPNILGSKTDSEKVEEDYTLGQPGITDLRADTPENKTFINRLMALIH